MELIQLRCVLALKEYKSFTKASQALYISQPYLSQLIKKLEDELGSKLFERSTQTLRLTEFGERFAIKAQKVINEMNELEELCNQNKVQLSIGFPERMKIIHLPELLTEFYLNHKDWTIKINTYKENELDSLFDDSKVDILFARENLCAKYKNDSRFTVDTFFRDPVMVVMRKQHPLAKYPVITKDQIITSKIYSHMKGSALRESIFEHITVQDPDQQIINFYTDNYDMISKMLHDHDVIALANQSFADYYNLHAIPLDPFHHNDAIAIYRNKASCYVQELVQFIEQYYKEG